MFQRLLLSTALAAVLVLSPGCLTTISESPTPDDVTQTGPFPDDYTKIVRKWILEDIFRIVSIDSLDVSTPEAGVSRWGLLGSAKQGWRANVQFSGRDRIGSSTGRMDYVVLIKDGEVVASQKRP